MSGWSGKLLPLLKTGIFTVFVPGVVAFWAPLRWLGVQRRWNDLPQHWWQYAGLPLLAAASLVYLWCAWDFAVTGLGTPAPIDAPRVLVVKGLYRLVRNPMYVGVLSVIFGWSIWLASLRVAVYGCVFWALAHGFVLLYEEPHLRRVFGEQYEEYRRRVNRWMPKDSDHRPATLRALAAQSKPATGEGGKEAAKRTSKKLNAEGAEIPKSSRRRG